MNWCYISERYYFLPFPFPVGRWSISAYQELAYSSVPTDLGVQKLFAVISLPRKVCLCLASIFMAFLFQTVDLISFFFPPRLWQWGFPSGVSSKESACQCRKCVRHGFNPWVRKIPWKRAWQPTPVFLPGEIPWIEEPGGLQSKGSQRVRCNWSGIA